MLVFITGLLSGVLFGLVDSSDIEMLSNEVDSVLEDNLRPNTDVSDIDISSNNTSEQKNLSVPRCPAAEVTDESMYMGMMTPNENETSKPPVDSIPMYISVTNSKGLRDQSFREEKPEDQFRVLVVGDSMTYGLGVNESNRFTEVLERRLNDSLERNVRVINAGKQAAGMEDYYEFVLNRGTKYDPDLVIVAFDEEDTVDRELQESFIEQEKDERGIPDDISIYSSEAAEDAVDAKLQGYVEGLQWRESDFREYMTKLLAMGDERDFQLYLYRITAGNTDDVEIVAEPVEGTEYDTVYDYWRQECGEKVIPPPENIARNRTYTFYPDPHFNPAGNRVLGKWLYSRLKKLSYSEAFEQDG